MSIDQDTWRLVNLRGRQILGMTIFKGSMQITLAPFGRIVIVATLISGVWGNALSATESRGASEYFGIQVVDAETERGVPLITLTTVNRMAYVTDSGGWVAFREPGLMDEEVFFAVSGHGYEYPADGFGNRGVRLHAKPGMNARIEIHRKNMAERLYRVTGQGIYRDSLLLNKVAPLAKPLLNAKVVGQDTVQARPYRGQIRWFWGDTNRPSYPLGHFKTAGAVSKLPSQGGLESSQGIDLKYFTGPSGFSREMIPFPEEGAIWLHGLFVLRTAGQEKLIGHYTRLKALGTPLEHGLVIYNDESQQFEQLVQFPLDAVLYPRGQSLAYEHDVSEYIYFCSPFPTIRVKAALPAIIDPSQYEAFTCLQPGTRYALEMPSIERDESGRLVVPEMDGDLNEITKPFIERDDQGRAVWGWKRDTGALDASQLRQLVSQGQLQKDDLKLALWSPNSEEPMYLHAGSVHWNAFRRRWVMIAEQLGGKSSFLGEIWYAESDALEGPWINPRHIVTHDKYSFYNPAHHEFFDEKQGRIIYFEGTYSDTFSAAKIPTPRYDYNQIMYRLDLGSKKMALP